MRNVYTFQQETYSQVIDEIKPILLKHWEEIALNKDKVPLDPDWEVYKFLESKDMMSLTTVREEGRLIGYVCYFLSPNPHYKTQRVAESDIFYLDPTNRNVGLGKELFLAAEEHLILKGVDRIVNRIKMHHDVGYLFESLGYTAIERVYSKLVS